MSVSNRVKKLVKKLIYSKRMLTGIGIASFLESTVVPIPLETILVPLMQSRREKLWTIAAVTTLGCVLGAILGYLVGYFVFDLLKEYVIGNITTQEEFDAFKESIKVNGFWFVFSTGVTPVPLQVGMLVAGVTQFSFLLYLIAVTSSRMIRYFGLALLVYFFGDKTEKLVRKYKWQTGFVMLAVITSIITLNLVLNGN